ALRISASSCSTRSSAARSARCHNASSPSLSGGTRDRSSCPHRRVLSSWTRSAGAGRRARGGRVVGISTARGSGDGGLDSFAGSARGRTGPDAGPGSGSGTTCGGGGGGGRDGGGGGGGGRSGAGGAH